jgi:methylmalonyl-CoA/ethylmalonyl-CoA epimerase
MDFEFHHGGVNVPNLDEALKWYEHFLGFTFERGFDIPPANARVAFVKKGNMRFEIFETQGAKPLPEERRLPNTDLHTHGNKHVAFVLDDIEPALAELTAKGADIPVVIREAFGKGFFVRDCAGNLIEFVEDFKGE